MRKRPVFSTIVASHVSGREVRDALYQNPIWQFELTSTASIGRRAPYPRPRRRLAAKPDRLFCASPRAISTFLYADPTDSAATERSPSRPATVRPQVSRSPATWARSSEPVGWVTSVSNVYLNGVEQASGWSLSTPNSLVFERGAGRRVPRSPQPSLSGVSNASSIPTIRISSSSCRPCGRRRA